ncbi:MAG: transposase, partial [Rhodoferax sp.]|nr:transposase [Rhodoferax sp.]
MCAKPNQRAWGSAPRKQQRLNISHWCFRQLRLLGKVRRLQGTLDEQAMTQLRRERALPRLEAMHGWLQAKREQVTDGTAIAKAMDYTLRRWGDLVRYAEDGRLPIDNNPIENLIRPWAVGRKNW